MPSLENENELVTVESTPEPEINQVWAKSAPEGIAVRLTTPSGQTCLATRLGMQGIIGLGILGEADSLTAFVDRKHVYRVRGANGAPDTEEVNMKTLMKDPQSLQKIVMLIDRAAPSIVTEPALLLHFIDLPNGETESIPMKDRDPNRVYTDQVGFEDKMFLFNWAIGGSSDVDRFREESGAAMGTLDDGEGLPRAAKRAARRRERGKGK